MQEVRLGGHVERMGANLDSRRTLSERLCGNGKVEQQVDTKARLRVEEVSADRRIETKPDDRDSTGGDRRDHVALLVETCGEFQSAVVEETDRPGKTVAGMRDHEVEIAGDP